MKKYIVGVVGLLGMMFCSVYAYAGNPDSNGNTECPVELLNGLTLDEEFGMGTAELTHCVKKRHHLKVAVEINRRCRSWADSSREGPCSGPGPDALGNMNNILKDYDITNGMQPGRDYTMIAIVHGGGGFLLLNDSTKNPYADTVRALMERGVKFYFCQNTVRGFMRGGFLEYPVADQLIDGVEFVTAGFTAVADVQQQGYSVITP